jgi:segregation and condensation protein B
MTDQDAIIRSAKVIEAMIFASANPVAEHMLDRHVPDEVQLQDILAVIAGRYGDDSGIEFIKAGQGWAFRTKADVAAMLNIEKDSERPLSRAALEVMAIIAYHQPITRAEIEEMRGVSISRGTMDILLELGWIKPRGRRRTPGRPLTWGTTEGFLDHFGLEDITALPGLDELKQAGLLRLGENISDRHDSPNLTEDSLTEDENDENTGFDDENLLKPSLMPDGDDDASDA